MGYTKSTGEPHVKPVTQLFREREKKDSGTLFPRINVENVG
jgi:hypothetical protein